MATGEYPRGPRVLDMLPRPDDEKNSKNVLSSENEPNIKAIEILDGSIDRDKESLISYSPHERADVTTMSSACTAEVNAQYSAIYPSDDALARSHKQSKSCTLVTSQEDAPQPLRLRGGGGVEDPFPLTTVVALLIGMALSTVFSLFSNFRKNK